MASKNNIIPGETNSVATRLFSTEMKRTIRKASTVSNEGTKFEVLVPGVSFSDFDREGNIGMAALAWYFGMVRYFVQSRSDYCTSIAIGDQTMFLLQIEYEITEHFYKITRDQSVWFATKFTSELIAFGRSTITTRSALFSTSATDYTRPLVTSKYKQALVNPVTRKSEALPENFRNKFEKFRNTDDEFVPYVVPKAPTHAFSCEFLMRFSDTDINHHVNNTNYILFCYDCATLAALRGGHLRSFTGDVCSRRAQTVKCSYLMECRAGDIVRSIVWEDALIPNTLHFIISKETMNVFYCCIKFFPELKLNSNL